MKGSDHRLYVGYPKLHKMKNYYQSIKNSFLANNADLLSIITPWLNHCDFETYFFNFDFQIGRERQMRMRFQGEKKQPIALVGVTKKSSPIGWGLGRNSTICQFGPFVGSVHWLMLGSFQHRPLDISSRCTLARCYIWHCDASTCRYSAL
jgi:hypothetical protein